MDRIDTRVEELKAFDPSSTVDGDSPALQALSRSITDTLVRSFGEATSAFHRYSDAATLYGSPGIITMGYSIPQSEYVDGVKEQIATAISLLGAAKQALAEDLADSEHDHPPSHLSQEQAAQPSMDRSVFVVHGHDVAALQSVARFLERLEFKAIILHEQANQGRTVIEKVVAHGNVGFAVVIMSPDDVGHAVGGTPEPRARQNVLLELGFFLGRLGRERVCTLKRGTLDIPSDFAGVVWEAMNDDGAWKMALGRELEAAGYEIDWNKVMRQ
ncbi:hypothetical protein PIN31115_04246 [Pandoraea iniqua]|uniref:CD-NTase-associated protein 12/Pycsar effector protein TIR domain-containing protein n=1 Tax=Pandoraea iniqua TaxID=2508288 RepID=A0A5E4Y3V2_9BURK|nr:nucleotide-binding protein [Pandoraea iniqua]VVE43314.1 hypothetical protein PIN31115_04246 [Pandoraea iniqua]